MNNRFMLAALAAAVLGIPAGAAAAQSAPWHDTLDAYVSEQVEATGLAAAAVAVVSADEVLYARGFGDTEVHGGTPVGANTAFEIGSLTKSMTALAVLRLSEAGRVELDAPVQAYLPWFRVADESAAAAITVRHLLAHTSGLPTISHGVVWSDFHRIDPSIVEGVRALRDVQLNRPPGEAFEYANMGYATLGAIIEAVTGEPWAEHVERAVFAPLGMHDSAAADTREGIEMAQAYTWRMGRRAPVPALSAFGAPAGSMTIASAADMAAYLQAWLSPSENGVVTPAAAEEAFRAHAPVGDSGGVGLGWVLSERHGERLVHHTGGTAGATSYMALLPEAGLGLVVLTNSMGAPALAIGFGALDVLLGSPPAAVTMDTGRRTSYVLTGITLAGVALLGFLAFRVARFARPHRARRQWLLAVRAAVVGAIAGGIWMFLPGLLASAGMPAPFGIRGYPFDVLFASLALLAVPTAWALYSLATLIASFRTVAPGPAHRTGATPT